MKNFFEICEQFGHVPSRSFASPPLDRWTLRNKVLWFFKNIQTTSPMTEHYIPEGQIIQHWMMFMNILKFISDCSYCLYLLCAAEAYAQHINMHTIWQLTNEQPYSSQFISASILRKTIDIHWEFNWTWILLHTHSLITNTLILAELANVLFHRNTHSNLINSI
jgi:hypothetical protein